MFLAARLLGRNKRPARAPTTPPALPPGESSAKPSGLPAVAGVAEQLESKLAAHDALQHKLDEQALSSLRLAPVITKTSEILAKHLRDKISKEPATSAQLLRTWIAEEDV